ncbi:GntR family transcriptional regulator [Saccharopolyspora hordei]|uniref:DNA-binding GntR family transcriptional regulator n=1 Tax=Saccharopolyspora hordei TaxID=1838 RepID=A0A853AK33_9PSEU|nr:GntR family transcriptional regulator [Saccharopolyspora hordei]NYI83439.1 DNA-binding GntR family transcriptional regulator [Saccharopolyspora hordei]
MSAAAKYQEIAATLRSQIDSGALSAGDQLPTEQALQEQFEASRTTVRQALKELRDAGLVQMRHGVGVFVAPPRVVRRLDSRERLAKARREQNRAAFLAEADDQGFTRRRRSGCGSNPRRTTRNSPAWPRIPSCASATG